MQELLPYLFVRGVTGRASDSDLRLLEWLANRDVNRKVFGQPLATTLEYYGPDCLALLTMSDAPQPGGIGAAEPKRGG